MKKLIFSATVTPNDDEVTLDHLKDALQHLGSACFSYEAEVELASAKGLTRAVWIYASCDDSEPYVQVSGPDETEGKTLSGDEADQLRATGVCTEFRAEYPRARKYGAPAYATGDDFAAGVVGIQGFKVNEEGLTVDAEDRLDDGGEQIWLKIALPE